VTRRRRLLVGSGVIAIALGALILTGVRQSVVYFVTPSELGAAPVAGKSYRLGGMVMPGTLMYECCLHTLRVFLLRLGWVTEDDGAVWEPVPGVVYVWEKAAVA